MANEAIEVEGLVLEILWWWKYKVKILDMDMEVEAYAAGKMKRFRIKIIPWDLVTVELNPYEPTKWRIVYRTINNWKNKAKFAKPDPRSRRGPKETKKDIRRAAKKKKEANSEDKKDTPTDKPKTDSEK